MAAYYWLKMHRYTGLRRLYRRYGSLSKSTGVNIWDAVILYEIIRRDKPRRILEFGTGASTAYMALALRENEDTSPTQSGVIVSVESEREFLEHQKDIFPEELKRFVDFVYGPVTRKDFGDQIGFAYENVPLGVYDLVWVDGPALNDAVRFSGDVVDILPSCSPNVRVLFDGRDETAQAVMKLIGPGYVMKRYPHVHMTEIRAKGMKTENLRSPIR